MSFNQRRGRPMPAEQQMSPDQLARRANEIDSFSTALINVGVTIVKRHPVPVGFVYNYYDPCCIVSHFLLYFLLFGCFTLDESVCSRCAGMSLFWWFGSHSGPGGRVYCTFVSDW
jgi:hypothetical protein